MLPKLSRKARKKKLTSPQIRKPINLLISTHTSIRAVFRNHQTISTQRGAGISPKDIALDEDLIVGAGVDGLVQKVLVQVVVEMLVSESTRGTSSSDVAPEIVVVRDVQVALIDFAEDVRVAD